MRASAQAGSLDAACFHAEQAAEKYLKAYLIDQDRPVPHTHNLYKLFSLCSESDPAFHHLIHTADLLTPFAVEARYDTEFWPTSQMLEQAEAAADRIAKFVSVRLPTAKIPRFGIHEAWKAARDHFSFQVDLRKFKDAKKYPGFFDRLIEPHQLVQFEDRFRAALNPSGRVESAAEVAYWKNGWNHKGRDRIARDLMEWIPGPEDWMRFVAALQELAREPSWKSFRKFITSNGQVAAFAVPVTFLSFYDPARFPMVDKRIGKWWSSRFPSEPQFTWGTKRTRITPTRKSFEAYLAWTEFCRRQAAYLSTTGERNWRARDVEMSVWTDVDAQLPLDE
jgi:HEPN domain-containing protein